MKRAEQACGDSNRKQHSFLPAAAPQAAQLLTFAAAPQAAQLLTFAAAPQAAQLAGPFFLAKILLVSLSACDEADAAFLSASPRFAAASSAVLECLAGFDGRLLDITQAVVHADATLGVLIEMSEGVDTTVLDAALQETVHEYAVTCRLRTLSATDYAHWTAQLLCPRYIVTLLARRLTSAQLAKVMRIVQAQQLAVYAVRRLSAPATLGNSELVNFGSGSSGLQGTDADSLAIVELDLRGELADQQGLRRALLAMSQTDALDVAVQADDVYRRNRRLVAFDMDSTLIQGEVIDALAAAHGVGPAVAAITAAAMRGEMDFTQSFRRRVALLAGADVQLLAQVAANVVLSEGAERLVRTLKRHGYRTAILSGGFQEVGELLRARLGIDVVHANRLEVRDGRFTGQVLGEVIDGQRKAALLKQLVAQEGLTLAQSIAVGDGANDIPMLSIAGLGIAYRAKPVVAASADHAITHLGLDAMLYLIGFTARDLLD